MSAFDGFIIGYPDVVADKFDGPCLQAKHMLLSHCHWDHMQGLESTSLEAHLLPAASSQSADSSQAGGRLYCSRHSAALLKSWRKYRHLARFLHPLDVHQSQSLGAGRTVTALPAAHCVGSVMFLLEGGEQTVLYTGDFRLTVEQLARMPALHDRAGRPRSIDLLYADNTFCLPDRRDLPDRQTSARHVVRLTKQFLAVGPQHKVNIVCSARLGYENLFKELCNATGQKICVQADKYELYCRVPDIKHLLTTSAEDARLFSVWPTSRLLAGGPVRTIKVSVKYFFMEQDTDCMAVQDTRYREEQYRVLYSTHASLREVLDMISYLRPVRVIPCVQPWEGHSIESIASLLNAAVNGSEDSRGIDVSAELNPSSDVDDVENNSVQDMEHGGVQQMPIESLSSGWDSGVSSCCDITAWPALGPLLTTTSMKMTRKRRYRTSRLSSSGSGSPNTTSSTRQQQEACGTKGDHQRLPLKTLQVKAEVQVCHTHEVGRRSGEEGRLCEVSADPAAVMEDAERPSSSAQVPENGTDSPSSAQVPEHGTASPSSAQAPEIGADNRPAWKFPFDSD